METRFQGFLRLRVDFDANKPLITNFSAPCPRLGSYTIRLSENRYNGNHRVEPSSKAPRKAALMGGANEDESQFKTYPHHTIRQTTRLWTHMACRYTAQPNLEFTIMDFFPPQTKFNEVSPESLNMASQFIKQSNGEGRWLSETDKSGSRITQGGGGFSSTPNTWITTQLEGIKKPLDRVLVTSNWKEKFINASVTHLDLCQLDHIPLFSINGWVNG
ncbi:hypothetical protein ACFX2I_007001 [Malus domestica]